MRNMETYVNKFLESLEGIPINLKYFIFTISIITSRMLKLFYNKELISTAIQLMTVLISLSFLPHKREILTKN